jgi:hypothetical protein
MVAVSSSKSLLPQNPAMSCDAISAFTAAAYMHFVEDWTRTVKRNIGRTINPGAMNLLGYGGHDLHCTERARRNRYAEDRAGTRRKIWAIEQRPTWVLFFNVGLFGIAGGSLVLASGRIEPDIVRLFCFLSRPLRAVCFDSCQDLERARDGKSMLVGKLMLIESLLSSFDEKPRTPAN